jgi:RNA polymerase sigma-70 factor (ECF subfamily)
LTRWENDDPDSFSTITDMEFDLALGCLTDTQRVTLELSQKGLSQIEVAKALATKPGTVAKRLFDARQRLRIELERIISERKGGPKS